MSEKFDKLILEWMALSAGMPTCGLIDQGLEGVDPFDVNLTTDMKMRIWKESKANPRYFFMYVLRAPEDEIAEIDRVATFHTRRIVEEGEGLIKVGQPKIENGMVVQEFKETP